MAQLLSSTGLIKNEIYCGNGNNYYFIEYRGNIYPLPNLRFDNRDFLMSNNETVCSIIKRFKSLKTARWLNHVKFKNAFQETMLFKEYIEKKYNVNLA